MAEFLVKMADERGHVLQQVESGVSEQEIRDRFAQQGFLVYSVKNRRGLLPMGGGLRKKGLKADQFVVFNQQFLTLIKAGLPILKSLGILSKRQKNPYFKSILENVQDRVKSGELRLMGFGHRVYKNYDPRATIIKGVADQVFEVTGRNPLLDIALELERIALEDEYFISHKLYPNVDFYSGIIYQAMGFPVAMFPVLFAIGRMPGWLAHWQEGSTDKEQKIARPRQIYVGETIRHLNGGEGEGGEGA